MKKFFCFLLLCGWCSALSANSLKPYLSYTAGRGVGYNRSYTSLGLFAFKGSPHYSILYPFFDIKGNLLNGGQKGYNVGIGARHLSPTMNQILGVNIYYDGLHEHHKNFHQIGIGLEYLSQCWDFRVNGYFPLGKQEKKFHSYTFSSGRFLKGWVHHRALTGGDAEIGWTLKQFNSFSWGLYLAGGPYYFSNRTNSNRSTFGGQCRLNLQLFSYLSFEMGFSTDRLFHSRYYGYVHFSIPLECLCPCEEIWRKLTEIPTRNDLIVTHRRSHWIKNYP